MHDIAESVLGDVATPLKRKLPDYQVIEYRNEMALFDHFGLPVKYKVCPSGEFTIPYLPDCVKEADYIALVTERRDLLSHQPSDEHDLHWGWAQDIKPLAQTISAWGHARAKHLFLARFFELCPSQFLTKKRWMHVLHHKVLAFLPVYGFLARSVFGVGEKH